MLPKKILSLCETDEKSVLANRFEKRRRRKMKNYKIAVAGTGYVGLSIATLLSQHNNRKSPILDDYIEKI